MKGNSIDGQFAANWAQLIEDDICFIVPAENYDVRDDARLLIPFMQNHKIGFVNRDAEPLVEPKYDFVSGMITDEMDLMRVGLRYNKSYICPNGEIKTNDKCKWGLIDSKGKVVVNCNYEYILISDDKSLFTVKSIDRQYGVFDRNGKEIVPCGKYHLIDGFTRGFARVRKEKSWGIIDTKGNEVLPVKYDEIWNFYNKPELKSTRVIQNASSELRFDLETGKLINLFQDNLRRHYSKDDYGTHYGEYAGSYAQDVMGFSDDVIGDAFDGEPDAYWNID